MLRIAKKHREQDADSLTVNASEAAKLIGISQRTLWQLSRQGVIPCIRAGRRVLYSKDMLKKYVNGELSTKDQNEE